MSSARSLGALCSFAKLARRNMLGHGRPLPLATAPASAALIVCFALADLTVGQEFQSPTLPAITSPVEPPITPTVEPVRFRITWGGGDARAWSGGARLDKGSFTGFQLLGLDADAAGSVWLERGQLRIGNLSPHILDRIETTAEAAPDAQLHLELVAATSEAPIKTQVALSELAKRPFRSRLDNRNNYLEIAIVTNPVIQISINRDEQARESLLFSPGETLRFASTLDLPSSLHGTTIDIQASLHPARRTDVPPLWVNSQKLNVPVDEKPRIDIEIPLQQPEGVYTVRIAVSRPSGYFRDRFFATTAPLTERTFEIAVIDPRPSAAVLSPGARVLEIDPTNPGWIDRLPSWTRIRRIPGLNLSHGPLGSTRASTVELRSGRFVELPAAAKNGEPHWQAYTLPVEAVGEPHQLEVDYPLEDEQHIGFTILEPNAVGVVERASRDTGVLVEGFGRTPSKVETHHVLFWPRTQAPMLVVMNRHPTAAARYGAIRVQRCNRVTAERPPAQNSSKRLVAAYISRPTLPETFGASQVGMAVESDATPRSIDDLQTFLESATRLSDHLRHSGHNAAVVSVLADGSSIFPLASTAVTPLYDSGRIVGRPAESDGLELALRVFDRDGLTLVPAVQFAAPLSKLEALRRTSDPHTSGLELVNREGRTWTDKHGSRTGLAPYYNLLDPRVQQAMLEIAAEIVERCGRHSSFGGLAIQLTSDGYAQLPPLGWGLDDATIARFEQATGIATNTAGTDRFAQRYTLLTGQHADAWRKWRTLEVARFYERMARIIRGNSDRRLLLTTEKLFDHPQAAQRIRPNLRDENRVAAALLEMGLDRQLLENAPGVTLCPTTYIGPTKPLPDCANDLEVNAAFARWQRQSAVDTASGAVLFHRSKELPLPTFVSHISPSLKVASDFQFVCEPVGHSALARQPYVQAIRGMDAELLLEGGDLLPLFQDQKLREMRATIARLPVAAQVSDVTVQPVLVRTYSESNQTTIVVLNASPWAAKAQVTLTLPRGVTLTPLAVSHDLKDGSSATRLTLAAGQQSWTVALEPNDLKAFQIDASGISVANVNVELEKVAKPELQAHLADLMNRDVSASRQFLELANPSFEPSAGGAGVSGWSLTDASMRNALIQLDSSAPQHGRTSLHFRNDGDFAAFQSDPFPIPPTGQLAMTVFARCKNAGPSTELRLVFESNNRGVRDRREAKVPCAQLVRPNQDWDPRPLAIPSNDLPLDSQGTMRVVFELNGPGEVWLDNVTMYDLLFPLSWYGSSQAEKLQLVKLTGSAENAFERDQFSDCLQLLDGYWPRFVMEFRPPNAPKVAVRPSVPAAAIPPEQQQPGAAPPADQGQQAAPGVMDRFKRWIPISR